MTTDKVEIEQDETAADGQVAEVDVPALDDEPAPETGKGNAEAAKWRRQFREAEGELTAIRAQVDTLMRQLIETALPGRVKPGLFWSHHDNDVTAFLAEDGTVNLDEVAASAQQLIGEYGLYGIRQSAGQGIAGGIAAGGDREPTTWGTALAGKG